MYKLDKWEIYPQTSLGMCMFISFYFTLLPSTNHATVTQRLVTRKESNKAQWSTNIKQYLWLEPSPYDKDELPFKTLLLKILLEMFVQNHKTNQVGEGNKVK